MNARIKILLSITFALFITFCPPTVALAHGGKTDQNGGHTDKNTGEYHYHHGYPAHSHYDIDRDGRIDCPYDFDDKTGQNSGSNRDINGSTSGNSSFQNDKHSTTPTITIEAPTYTTAPKDNNSPSNAKKTSTQNTSLEFWDLLFSKEYLCIAAIDAMLLSLLYFLHKKLDATTIPRINKTIKILCAVLSLITLPLILAIGIVIAAIAYVAYLLYMISLLFYYFFLKIKDFVLWIFSKLKKNNR